jgi:hypothetical protein
VDREDVLTDFERDFPALLLTSDLLRFVIVAGDFCDTRLFCFFTDFFAGAGLTRAVLLRTSLSRAVLTPRWSTRDDLFSLSGRCLFFLTALVRVRCRSVVVRFEITGFFF